MFGKVKSWNGNAGYGFIIAARPDSEELVDYFANRQGIKTTDAQGNPHLKPGAHVEFTPMQHGDRYRAKNVRYVVDIEIKEPSQPGKAGAL